MIKNIFKIIFILIFFSHLSYSLDKPNFILILTDDQASLEQTSKWIFELVIRMVMAI